MSFLGEGSPTQVDYRKNIGTVVLTSLLEDLVPVLLYPQTKTHPNVPGYGFCAWLLGMVQWGDKHRGNTNFPPKPGDNSLIFHKFPRPTRNFNRGARSPRRNRRLTALLAERPHRRPVRPTESAALGFGVGAVLFALLGALGPKTPPPLMLVSPCWGRILVALLFVWPFDGILSGCAPMLQVGKMSWPLVTRERS